MVKETCKILDLIYAAYLNDQCQHIFVESFLHSTASVDWVHVIAMPDLYRGPYQGDDPLAIKKYIANTRDMLEKVRLNGRKVRSIYSKFRLF